MTRYLEKRPVDAKAYGLKKDEVTREKIARILPHIVVIRIEIAPDLVSSRDPTVREYILMLRCPDGQDAHHADDRRGRPPRSEDSGGSNREGRKPGDRGRNSTGSWSGSARPALGSQRHGRG